MADKAKKPAGAVTLISESDPKSPASEAYRSLRTNIAFAGLDSPCRSIVVTSSTAGEGKTTTVANFGTVAAQGGARVCVIDSDLRRPSLHRLFGLSNTEGLSNALVQGSPLAKVARATRTPNLSVLTSGPLPPNPAELVASKRMHDFIAEATQDFDLILCDTPPVISVSDGLSLAAQCDGVILVVRVGMVPRDVIKRAARQIEAVKGRIIGVLLNSVNFKRDAYYYDYYRYYHAYYGPRQER